MQANIEDPLRIIEIAISFLAFVVPFVFSVYQWRKTRLAKESDVDDNDGKESKST